MCEKHPKYSRFLEKCLGNIKKWIQIFDIYTKMYSCLNETRLKRTWPELKASKLGTTNWFFRYVTYKNQNPDFYPYDPKST